MPVVRGPDGVPFEVPTHYPEKKGPAQPSRPVPAKNPSAFDDQGDVPTRPHTPDGAPVGGAARAAPRPAGLFPEEPPTRPHRKSPGPVEAPERSPVYAEEPRTVIHGGAGRAKTASPRQAEVGGEAGATPIEEAMSDPLAGWLVIVDGPGMGNALRIGFGQSSIGRGAGERIRLDFGDNKVSRTSHAFIIYDPRSTQFYIRPGDGVNLLHVDEELVMMPRLLKDRSRLLIGSTHLMFVAFCGPHFSWPEPA